MIVDSYVVHNLDFKNSPFNTLIGSNFPLSRDLKAGVMDDIGTEICAFQAEVDRFWRGHTSLTKPDEVWNNINVSIV